MQVDPLARAWKTTESVITVGLGVLIAALSAVDPSVLPHKWAGVFTVVLAVVLQVSRSWVKASAAGTALWNVKDEQAREADLLAEAEAADGKDA